MASLLARAVRANTRKNFLRVAHTLPRPSAARIDLTRAAVWGRPRVSASFCSIGTPVEATATIEEGGGDSTESEEELRDKWRASREAFYAKINRFHSWVEKRANGGDFDGILRALYERYEPLYATHPALKDVPCSLCEAYADPDALARKKSRFKPKTANDHVIRLVEVKMMEEFVAKKRPDLAAIVYHHRMMIAATVGTMEDTNTGRLTDFTLHNKNFWPAAIRTFSFLGDDAKVVSLYKEMLKHHSSPHGVMTKMCLTALLRLGDFEAVRALYEEIKATSRDVTPSFFKQMLFFASLNGDGGLMREIYETMKTQGIALDSEDYLNATRSLQNFYLRDQAAEKYHDCIARLAREAASPDAYKETHDACRAVLSLFDEMVDVEKIVPHHKIFFAHVIRAAQLVQDYDRVAKYASLFESTFDEPLTGGKSMLNVTNCLLLRNDPVAAGKLVAKALEVARRAHEPPHNKVLCSITSVLQYLGDRQDLSLTRRFLSDLKAKSLLPLLRREQHCCLIDGVVLDTEHVSDSTIENMLREYPSAFCVHRKESSLERFAQACVKTNRWSLLRRVLTSRNTIKFPMIPSSLAVSISGRAAEDSSDLARVELTAELIWIVDLSALEDADRVTLSVNAAHAIQALQGFHQDNGEIRSAYYRKMIHGLHARLLADNPDALDVLPADVRELFTPGDTKSDSDAQHAAEVP